MQSDAGAGAGSGSHVQRRTLSSLSSTSSSSAAPAAATESTSTVQQTLAIRLDHPVTSISMSPSGRDAVLAAKRGLYIVDLEKPFDPPRFLQHLTKWDVADVQWNPHHSRSNWIATTSNQKALIWNISRGVQLVDAVRTNSSSNQNYVEYILSKHVRAVSDIHWSPFHPETIATCSYDAYIHIWDLRMSTSKPSASFSSWTVGATQVKFNRINEWTLASSHDTDIRIWDIRKLGSSPMTLITAHMTKIYGIDWSRRDENEIITCSQDKLVKPRMCQSMIATTSPVWRARFTPFGNAVMTMPQRKDTNLYLWGCDNKTTPLYTFSGHSDMPTEFVWRYYDGHYQLVTWSKDHTLRLWPVTPEFVKYAKSPSKHTTVSRQHSGIITLEEEIEQIRALFPHVHIDKTHGTKRMYSISLQRVSDTSHGVGPLPPSAFFRVDVQFPAKYPGSAPPTFEIQKTSIMSMANRTSLAVKLGQIGSTFAEKSMPCLEACIRYLLGDPNAAIPVPNTHNFPVDVAHSGSVSGASTGVSIDSYADRDYGVRETPPGLELGGIGHVAADSLSISDSSSEADGSIEIMGQRVRPIGDRRLVRETALGKDNSNVPFPRLCGASFTMSGKLVYFRSPLPHPSMTKFTAYTLSTRKQQPVLQSQHFQTQPKTYPLYENYRAFVLARFPKWMAAGSTAAAGGSTTDAAVVPAEPNTTTQGRNKNNKMDYWLDDEPGGDETPAPSLYWRPKPLTSFQPMTFSSPDFLAQLQRFNSPTPKSQSSATMTPVRKPPQAASASASDLQLDSRRTSDADMIKRSPAPTAHPKASLQQGLEPIIMHRHQLSNTSISSDRSNAQNESTPLIESKNIDGTVVYNLPRTASDSSLDSNEELISSEGPLRFAHVDNTQQAATSSSSTTTSKPAEAGVAMSVIPTNTTVSDSVDNRPTALRMRLATNQSGSSIQSSPSTVRRVPNVTAHTRSVSDQGVTAQNVAQNEETHGSLSMSDV
eukprot:jgi/Hompol1/6242/HPOL_004901-RA